MQPAAPVSAARKKMIAQVELSAWESNPEARQPLARKAALRQTHKTIRRYFLSAFPAFGTRLPSPGKHSRVTSASDLFVRIPFSFFVLLVSIATLAGRC
jgi:hypothetical protein